MKIKLLIFAVFTFSSFTLLCQSKPISVKLNPNSVNNQHLKLTIENNASNLLTKLSKLDENLQFLSNQHSFLNEDAAKKLTEIVNNTPIEILQDSYVENLLKTQNGYQIRNISVMAGDKHQTLVIDFLTDGKIDDLYFGLEQNHYNDIMTFNSVVDRTRREIILNFVENFRTAYIRKDIDLIEKVFSEHALIITGKVVKRDKKKMDVYRTTLTDKQIEYQVLSKSQYISRLRDVFSKTPYINLSYEDIEVTQHKKFPDFYGVQLYQTWITPNYSDQGFLFLLIQFRADDNPLIWVRTWQDKKDLEKDKDGEADIAFEKDSAFGIHNFKIREGAIH